MNERRTAAWSRGGGVLGALVLGAIAMACASTANDAAGPGAGINPRPGTGSPDPSSSGSSGGSTDAAACAPSDETNLKPAWHPPHAHEALCDGAQLDSLFACIRDSSANPGSSPPASCAPWASGMTAANQACYSCIITDDTEAAWGAIVVHSNLHTQETNFAGCAAIAEDKLDGSGCGGQIAADIECGNDACGANCPVDKSGNGLDALNACLAAADKGTCSRFAQGATCLFVEAGPLSVCNPESYPGDSDGLTTAQAVAGVFCGGGTGELPDGGGD